MAASSRTRTPGSATSCPRPGPAISPAGPGRPGSSTTTRGPISRSRWPDGSRGRRSVLLLALAPAARAVVRDDVPEHGGEGGRVDGFSLVNRHGPGRLVAVASRDDPVRVRDDRAVVEEDVDVIPGRQQRADVALQDEVGQAGALDGPGHLR